jgi:beta-lactamase regulating signal transducer with metallopeptidase domain/uncharacterized GH25 family protein
MNPHPRLESVLNWLLNHSLQAGMLVLLVLLVQWAFRRHLTSRWRFALWWIVLIRLVLPLNFESTISLFNFFQPTVSLQGPRYAGPPPAPPVATRAETSTPKSFPLEPTPALPPENNFAPALEPALRPTTVPRTATAPTTIVTPRPAATLDFDDLLLPSLASLWVAGALGLSLVVGIQLFRFRNQLVRSAAIAAPDLRELLDDCRHEFGVTRRIELLETNAVASPALFGLLRLRLLLPVGLSGKFSRRELRYIFLHELAHVKRGDLWLNWLVTALQLMHWFNPLVWLGFARLRADRELACDELALVRAGETSGTPYGETIIKLLAGLGRPAAVPGLVGILEDKKQMQRRISMIASFRKPGRWSALAAILLLGLAATALTDAQTPKSLTPSQAAVTREAAAVAAPPTNSTTELSRPDLFGQVRAKDGSPLAATVFLATATPKTGTSTFCPSCYADCRKSAKTDAAGNFHIASLDPQLTFQVLAVAKGYKPKFVSKVDPAKGPAQIQLDKAERTDAAPEHSIRGRVVNAKGTPIEGAVVEMQGVRTKDDRGSWGSLPGVDPLAVTDEKGEFLLTSRDPFASMDVKVKARLFANRNFQKLESGETAHELVLTEGATLTGRVLQEGRPLKGVLVGISASDRSSGSYLGNFEIGTDAEGRFVFVNLPPDADFEIYGVMNALKPFGAISAQRVRTAKDGETSDIGDLLVRPAYRLAGKVVLADGGVITNKTRLLVSREGAWDSMQLTLDADGNFDSPGIPAEAVSLSVRVNGYRVSGQNPSLDPLNPYRLIGRVDRNITNLVLLLEKGPNLEPDYNSQRPESEWPQNRPLRGAETPADHSREWKISGRVLDRATREPVESFRITTGQTDSFDRTSWETARARPGSNGVYFTYISKRLNQPLLLAEAEGYQPASVTVLPGDATNVDFLLTKGTGPSGTVVLADGAPAAGVSVALLDHGQNQVGFSPDKAELMAHWKKDLLRKTDAAGKFAFPPLWGVKSLIAASTNGFALVDLETLATNPVVTLSPYGRVSGTLTRTAGPGAKENLDLSFANPHLSWLSLNLHAVTDAQGRFSFERVPPGNFQITYRQAMRGQPMNSWQNQTLQKIELRPGQSLTLDIKTTDRPVANEEGLEFAPPPSPKRIPGTELKGTVLRPDGKPAADAEVGLLVEGKYLAFGKGTFRATHLRAEGLIVNTDAQGNFILPQCEKTETVLALNDEGFARVTLAELNASHLIKLEKWGRIEGTLRIGPRPGTNESMLIQSPGYAPGRFQYDFNAYQTRTDESGRFVFTYVPPGENQVVRLVPSGEGKMHRPLGIVTVKPGQTTSTNLGGDGRTVIGKVTFTGTNAPVDLSKTSLSIHTPTSALMERMKQLKTDEERKNFFQSEAAKAATQKYRNYPGSINSDGSFQVEEVPAGEYELTLQPNASMAFRPGQLPTAIVIYHSIRPIVIASPADPKGEFPHNCGTVELKEATIPVPNAAR